MAHKNARAFSYDKVGKKLFLKKLSYYHVICSTLKRLKFNQNLSYNRAVLTVYRLSEPKND